MPVETTGFWLKPVNFFSENPSLDIPRERNAASREVKVQAQLPALSRQPVAAAACAHCDSAEAAPAPAKAASRM